MPAGTARKSWGTGGFLRSSFPGIQGKDSCIVVLDQGGKLPLIGCLIMTFFNTRFIQMHGKELKKFCGESYTQDGDLGQRGSVIFW